MCRPLNIWPRSDPSEWDIWGRDYDLRLKSLSRGAVALRTSTGREIFFSLSELFRQDSGWQEEPLNWKDVAVSEWTARVLRLHDCRRNFVLDLKLTLRKRGWMPLISNRNIINHIYFADNFFYDKMITIPRLMSLARYLKQDFVLKVFTFGKLLQWNNAMKSLLLDLFTRM